MRFSGAYQASPHCVPSPDGSRIAALLPSCIQIRSVSSPDLNVNFNLPATVSGPVTAFSWSPSSTRLLVALADQIHVFSAAGGDYHAVVQNPASATVKSTCVQFGATDDEVCVFSAFGIKLTVFGLSTMKAVEIANPKYYNLSSVSRGLSFRPQTQHLTLLTRSGGKDTISIHSSQTRGAERSWFPETIDAQGIKWSPDGRWLVVWESAAHGHKALFYTPDGNLFKKWHGPRPHAANDVDQSLGAGIKSLEFRPNGQHVAVSDSSRCICILNATTVVEETRLRHPESLEPKDTLQIWQEQTVSASSDTTAASFVKASQPVIPPGRPSNNYQEHQSGPDTLTYDCSSTLLATKLEKCPTTVWIWDVPTSELRAVLVFHNEVIMLSWHSSQPECLLIRCDDSQRNASVYVWDPLSSGPCLVDFASNWPGHQLRPKPEVAWLNLDTRPACLFCADDHYFAVACLEDPEYISAPWETDVLEETRTAASGRPAEVPLGLTRNPAEICSDDSDTDEDVSQLDDTFHFKQNTAL